MDTSEPCPDCGTLNWHVHREKGGDVVSTCLGCRREFWTVRLKTDDPDFEAKIARALGIAYEAKN